MEGRYNMIKKLISAVAATAIAMTAFASLAFAEKTYDIRLDSGVSYTDDVDTYGSQYFSVWCDDLAGQYTSYVQAQIKVISGAVGTDASNFEFSVVGGLDSKKGLYTPGRAKTYLAGTAFTQNIDTDAEGNQWIKVTWSSSAPAMTDDGMLFEFYVTPKDAAADIELEIGTVGSVSGVNTCTSTNSDKVTYFFEPATAPQYVLAAGTSTITEKSTSTEDTVDTTYTGTTQIEGTGTQAVSFRRTEAIQTGKTPYWEAKFGGVTKYCKANTANLSGNGNVKLGLVYVGTEAISDVTLTWK